MGNVTEAVGRDTASLVSLLAVTLIGVALVLMPHAWHRFRSMFGISSKMVGRRIVWSMVAVVSLIALGLWIRNLVVDFEDNLLLLTKVTIWSWVAAFVIVLLVLYLRSRMRPSTVEVLAFGNMFCSFGACLLLILSIACHLSALLGVGSMALDIEWRGTVGESFIWGKWFLANGATCFTMALIVFASSYVFEIMSMWLWDTLRRIIVKAENKATSRQKRRSTSRSR